jgi:hypothetical protein
MELSRFFPSPERTTDQSPPLSDPVIVDPYQVLQVRKDATDSEIRHSYRRLALWNHPGRSANASREERERRLQVFGVLAACYETLLDKEARRRFDALHRDFDYRARIRHIPKGDIRVGGRNVKAETINSKQSKRPETREEAYPTHCLPTLALASSDTSSNPDQPETNLTETLHANSKDVGIPVVKQSDPTDRQDSMRLWSCGMIDSLTPENDTAQSTTHIPSTNEEDEDLDIQYTESEMNRLFGGPLQLLFRARRWEPFRDPFQVFAMVFGSELSLSRPLVAMDAPKTNEVIPLSPSRSSQPSGWTGRSETLANGTVVFTTSRLLSDRKVIRTEAVRTDPVTKEQYAYVTVTSEPLDSDSVVDGKKAVRLDFCGYFSFCATDTTMERVATNNESGTWSMCGCGAW